MSDRIDEKELAEFLVLAKKKAFAGNGKYVKHAGGNTFEYNSDKYKFRDTYNELENPNCLSIDAFKGMENVFSGDEIIWGMCYKGCLLDIDWKGPLIDIPKKNQINAFLKKALSQVTPEFPFRGPPKFSNGDFKYNMQHYGNIENFYGEEQIKDIGRTVFFSTFRGQIVQ